MENQWCHVVQLPKLQQFDMYYKYQTREFWKVNYCISNTWFDKNSHDLKGREFWKLKINIKYIIVLMIK